MPEKQSIFFNRLFLLSSVMLLMAAVCAGQSNWKLTKSKNGINVYTSEVANSSFKAVKVECTLSGTYTKLMALLQDVDGFENWIYNNKKSKILKKNSPNDFIYYSETSMPIPFSNRDVVIRMQIKTDSLPKFLTIQGGHQPDFLPEIPGRQRISHYKASWKVTMPTANTIHIVYFMEVDPGGSLPAWLANSFADKGPYHTFSNLADKLK
ncbi:MAG TPA: START domain-containing protein [Chitinophagaceae bacterium]|jgi:hypothetical protein|nr:START domain-containing protein [Chitinophagaceae bacterium]HRG91399.1 START domain-containing protein [Chitinophagaceae bacterium]